MAGNTGLKESIEGVGAHKLLEDETGRKIRDCAMNELLTNVGLPGIGCTERKRPVVEAGTQFTFSFTIISPLSLVPIDLFIDTCPSHLEHQFFNVENF